MKGFRLEIAQLFGCIFVFLILFSKTDADLKYSNKFVFEISETDLVGLRNDLIRIFRFRYIGNIHSDFYLFANEDLPDISDHKWSSREFKKLLEEYRVIYCEQEVYQPISYGSVSLSPHLDLPNILENYSTNPEYWTKNTCISESSVTVGIVDNGIEFSHTNLRDRINIKLSIDFFTNLQGGNVVDYEPYPDIYSELSHGTSCAGLVAATGNGNCSTGVAPNARLASLKILDPRFPFLLGSRAAKALSYENNLIQIYSNSWGIGESECGFVELSKVTQHALSNGVTDGRTGKGNIYAFPSGNGGRSDNCNADGFASSTETITIGSLTMEGNVASFAEPCPCVLASTIAESLDGNYFETTSLGNKCSRDFHGSSAATAIASGIFALVLEANPKLTKRDLEHIIVTTARTTNPSVTWAVNGANKRFNDYVGFGMLDVDAMIKEAKNWTNVPTSRVCSSHCTDSKVKSTINGMSLVTLNITANGCSGRENEINFLEYVKLEMNLEAASMDQVAITLISPMGTNSHLLTKRRDKCPELRKMISWNFTSSHFWDENPEGIWQVQVIHESEMEISMVSVENVTLHFYGFGVASINEKYGATDLFKIERIETLPGDLNIWKMGMLKAAGVKIFALVVIIDILFELYFGK